jgi:hypothetical protein
MLDFSPIRNKEMIWSEFALRFKKEDLPEATNAYYDRVLGLIQDCRDEDVVFVPDDPDAHDPFAENPEDEDLAWTLGHVIVHLIASNDESAFLAAELARGVEMEARRSRAEVPWETMTTIQQCRQYLAESRRLMLASLEMWPDEPHLDNFYVAKSGLIVTPILRFVYGLSHCDSHLEQIEKIVEQARSAEA